MSAAPNDLATLLAYRLRPLDPLTLTGAVVVAAGAGLWMIPAAAPPPPEVLTTADVTTPLAVVAVALALAAGFVGGRDVDVAEPLLFASPLPHWRAVLLRVALWAAAAAAIVWTLAARGEGALDLDSHALRAQALVYLAFATAVVFALSRAAGSLAGGGAALALFLLLAGLPVAYEGFPLQVLAAAGSPAWKTTAVRLEILTAALLLVTFWRLRRPSRS